MSFNNFDNFIKNNSKSVPLPPSNELETILKKIDKKRPWYQKMNTPLHILVPAMTLTLIFALFISISTPVERLDEKQLNTFIAESYDIFDNDVDGYSL